MNNGNYRLSKKVGKLLYLISSSKFYNIKIDNKSEITA